MKSNLQKGVVLSTAPGILNYRKDWRSSKKMKSWLNMDSLGSAHKWSSSNYFALVDCLLPLNLEYKLSSLLKKIRIYKLKQFLKIIRILSFCLPNNSICCSCTTIISFVCLYKTKKRMTFSAEFKEDKKKEYSFCQ